MLVKNNANIVNSDTTARGTRTALAQPAVAEYSVDAAVKPTAVPKFNQDHDVDSKIALDESVIAKSPFSELNFLSRIAKASPLVQSQVIDDEEMRKSVSSGAEHNFRPNNNEGEDILQRYRQFNECRDTHLVTEGKLRRIKKTV